MFNSIFKIIYFLELVIAIIIRKSYERKFIKLDVEIQKKNTIAQIMILHNWIAGYSFLIVQVPFYFIRIKNEEEMMIEQFGAAYKAYMEKTDRLIPKLI
ncbi:MAG: hypothetical protein ABII90_15725 [Bacteroidota bacterium]